MAAGSTYFGIDTAQYLLAAIEALHALPVMPDCVVVTGDLVNSGRRAEYERFRDVMRALRVPYFVVPGNHDDADALRATLAPATFGGSRDARMRYVVDEFAVRIVGFDSNTVGSSPGAELDAATLEWFTNVVAELPPKPTLVCVHQPPFRSGLHYLDVFGFRGARRLRRLVERAPHVGRVVCGHIHCVKVRRWQHALACSAPSTAPQIVPLVFMDGKVFGMRHERPGFALHEWSDEGAITTTFFRRTADERYVAGAPGST